MAGPIQLSAAQGCKGELHIGANAGMGRPQGQQQEEQGLEQLQKMVSRQQLRDSDRGRLSADRAGTRVTRTHTIYQLACLEAFAVL